MILTSPPYDGLRDYGGHAFDFDRMADACVAAIKNGGVLVWVVADATINGSETGTSFRQALGFMERGLNLHDTMIYEKTHGGTINAKRYTQRFEYMFVLSKGIPATMNPIVDVSNVTAGRNERTSPTGRTQDGRRKPGLSHKIRPAYGKRGNVWKYPAGYHHSAPGFPDAHEHPAIFPYALACDHISTWTNEGDLVIDPMCGSDTTVRAAVNLGRRAVGVDAHAPYVALAERRMSQITLDV